jgi:hypothetical protein
MDGPSGAHCPASVGVGSAVGAYIWLIYLLEGPRAGGSHTRQSTGARRRLAGNGIGISGKRHEEDAPGCPRSPYLHVSLVTRTLTPTSANNVDSDGAVARVGFIRYAKMALVFSNSDRRVMFDSSRFGVIYKVQRHRCVAH